MAVRCSLSGNFQIVSNQQVGRKIANEPRTLENESFLKCDNFYSTPRLIRGFV